MKALLLALLAFAACDKHSAAAPPPSADPGFVVHEIAPADGALADVLAREVSLARARKLTPFAYVGATWCGPCNAIKHNLDKPIMIDAFRGTYVVKLDLDAWEGKLASAGLAHDSVPVFFALDEHGKPGRSIDGGAWGNDTPENIAPALKAFFHR